MLDPILEQLIEGQRGLSGIVPPPGADAALVRRIAARVDRNEYKRRQAPLVLRTSQKAFGPGRRLPIAHRYRRSKRREAARAASRRRAKIRETTRLANERPSCSAADRAHVLGAGAARALLHDVLDGVALGERVVVGRPETRAVEEDFLAVVAAHEAEAALAHQLLDLALHLRSARHRARHRWPPRTPAARAAAAACCSGRRARTPRGRARVGTTRSWRSARLRREQHLFVPGIDDGVTQSRVAVGHAGTRFDVFHFEHGTRPRGAAVGGGWQRQPALRRLCEGSARSRRTAGRTALAPTAARSAGKPIT